MNLYIDIETIPTQREDIIKRIADSVTHPGNISKPETIAKWEEEKKAEAVEKAWRQTALDGTFGELICIGWAIDDGDITVNARTLEEPERNVLEDFYSAVMAMTNTPGRPRLPQWVGHNILDFDVRFLWQRSIVNRLAPMPMPIYARPWGDAVFDTMKQWAGARGTISQDNLARALGLPGKQGMDGSMVWDKVKEGKLGEVMEYCRSDVSTIRDMYRLMVPSMESVDER